jgi:hypothetical protein
MGISPVPESVRLRLTPTYLPGARRAQHESEGAKPARTAREPSTRVSTAG